MASLSVRFSQTAVRRGVYDYALKVEVSSAIGIPRKVFVFHQMPSGPDGNTFAQFAHVASPVDLQEYPEDAASATVPWYRTDKCVIWCRCADDLALAKQMFVDDIAQLKRAYENLSSDENFTVQTTVNFTGPNAAISVTDASGKGGVTVEEVDGVSVDDALAGVTVQTDTIDGIRDAVGLLSKTLGATVAARKDGES